MPIAAMKGTTEEVENITTRQGDGSPSEILQTDTATIEEATEVASRINFRRATGFGSVGQFI
jgi:hypothetical protein